MNASASKSASNPAHAVRRLWLSRSPFLLRRLHSLTGIVPVGVFLVEHLWTNATVASGQASFDHAVGEIQNIPFLPLVEVFGIFLPLAFHAIYGVYLMRNGSLIPGAYTYRRNWAYVLQRVTGMLVFAFVLWHLWEFRIQKLLFGMRSEAFFPTLVAHLSATYFGVPWMALVYLASIAAACFHLANGLWGAACSWGITVSRRAQQRAAWVFGVAGVALFVLGANSVVYLANGTRLLPDWSDSTSAATRAAASCAASATSSAHAASVSRPVDSTGDTRTLSTAAPRP